MKRIKPGKLRSLREIELEKERFRYLALKTELEFSSQLKLARKLFTIPNLLNQGQSLLTDYIKKLIIGRFS